MILLNQLPNRLDESQSNTFCNAIPKSTYPFFFLEGRDKEKKGIINIIIQKLTLCISSSKT